MTKEAVARRNEARVTARVPKKVQDRLQYAADLAGATLNQFLVQSALKEAEAIIEQENLFVQFKLDEPWDSAHNKKLLSRMPAVYSAPNTKTKEPHATFYQVFMGKGTIFEGPRGGRINDITDGTSNTLFFSESIIRGINLNVNTWGEPGSYWGGARWGSFAVLKSGKYCCTGSSNPTLPCS